MKKLQKQQTTLKTSKYEANLRKEPRHRRTSQPPSLLMAQGTQIQSTMTLQEKAAHFQLLLDPRILQIIASGMNFLAERPG